MSLVLHKTERVSATEPVAQWLSAILNPAILAAGFSSPPPLEIRPTGVVGGWCHQKSHAPDGRVSISKKLIFWNKESIICTYLHESAHRLSDGQEVAHGPEFFLLNLVLHARCASLFAAEAAQKLSFYDLQDCPDVLANEPGWRGIVVSWALPKAEQIVRENADKTAEEIVPIVIAAWAEFLVQRAKSAQQVAQRARQIVAQAEEIIALKSDRNFWRVTSIFLMFFVFWLISQLFKGG